MKEDATIFGQSEIRVPGTNACFGNKKTSTRGSGPGRDDVRFVFDGKSKWP